MHLVWQYPATPKSRPSTSLSFPHFTFLSSVRDLGLTLESSLSFWNLISNLTRFSYFHLRCLMAIRKSHSAPSFHRFVCSRINCCNALLIDLPKVQLSPLQTVFGASARLVARLPRVSLISSFMMQKLHLLHCPH